MLLKVIISDFLVFVKCGDELSLLSEWILKCCGYELFKF